ncbi:hypothetical protein DENSPDRAFT_887477, partial [Dentipellis sp. KUC8613]
AASSSFAVPAEPTPSPARPSPTNALPALPSLLPVLVGSGLRSLPQATSGPSSFAHLAAAPHAVKSLAKERRPCLKVGKERQKQRLKEHRAQKQREKREREAKASRRLAPVRAKIAAKYSSPLVQSAQEFLASSLPHTKPGWVGLAKGEIEGRVLTLDEALKLGMRLIKWDGSTHGVIAGDDDIPVVTLVGRPDDPIECKPGSTWQDSMGRIYSSFEALAKANGLVGPTPKSRGEYPVILCGVSLGGGPQEPYRIATSDDARPLLDDDDAPSRLQLLASGKATETR